MRVLALVFSLTLAAGACSSASGETTTTTTAFPGTTIQLRSTTANAGPAAIVLEYTLPDGYKVNDEAPSEVKVTRGNEVVALTAGQAADLTGVGLPATVPVTLTEGSASVTFEVTLIYCEAVDTDLCLSDSARFVMPLTVGPAGPSSLLLIDRGTALPAG